MQPDLGMYADWPTFAGTPSSFDKDLCAGFMFGISNNAITLPDRNSSRGTHFRDLRQLTKDEAVELLAARIRGKATAAARQGPERAQLLMAHLASWRFSNPILQSALADALASLSAAIAPAPQPVETIAAIRGQLAALTAQLDQLEAQGTGR